ncbi:hypothetical protein [Actinoplanes rectilineatus]|uniref:hypothetical protein n=1 Tax=Actinoplanes rectilineatus TaxID=113571 RepID=UPI0005F2A8DA|nr:hypothetical protein [Actinoplanes rectilineatus]
MAGSAREEAERLVAALLARASSPTAQADVLGLLGMVADSVPSGPWSTGGAECCVCPVCRAIAAVRDPDPEVAERIATSAGDIAQGVAGLMRAFSSLATATAATPAPSPEPASAFGGQAAPDDPWAAATAESAREAAEAARARAAAAEQAVARAVEQARRAAEAAATATAATGATGPSGEGGGPVPPRARPGSDVWAAATAEAPAQAAATPRSVDQDPEKSEPGGV